MLHQNREKRSLRKQIMIPTTDTTTTDTKRPVSQKQLAANRLNALKCRGPRSLEGKKKSRLNAVRDNLTGQVISLSPEDRPIFEALKAEHVAALNPQTLEEHKLAHSIAWDTWRLDRLRATEMNIYALGVAEAEADAEAEAEAEAAAQSQSDTAYTDTTPTPDPIDHNLTTSIANAQTLLTESRRFELLSLYEQRLNRGIHRNRAALQALQDDRRRRYTHDKKEEMLVARLDELADRPYKAPDHPTPNGFVFSTDEIRAAAERQRNLEASLFLLANKSPWEKYGSMGSGSPDLFANLPWRPPPDSIPKKIHGVSPESIALRKYQHPEEFEKKRR